MARRRLLVAVLLEGEVAAEVRGLRRAITGHEGHLDPHVTLVPPVNVAEAALGAALEVVRGAAAEAAPFHLELGPPEVFARPARAVLHLAVGGDLASLAALRADAARPPLADPTERAPRPFVPHVTLGRLPPGRAAGLVEALAAYRAAVTVGAVQLFEEEAGPDGRRWEVVAEEALGGRAVRHRGGLQVEIHLSGRLDPEAAAALAVGAPGEEGPKAGRGPGEAKGWSSLAFVARREGVVVGAATARRRGAALWCTWLRVLPAERGLGVGSRLIDALERHAAEQGAAVVGHVVPAGSQLASWLARRGYVPVGSLRHLGGAGEEVVLERSVPPVD